MAGESRGVFVSRVQIRSAALRRPLVARLGEGIPTLSGYGTWETITRPLRTDALEWQGTPARRLELALLFDGWAEGNSVEGPCRTLEGLTAARSGGRPPATVRLRGPVPRTELTWIVEEIEWGDAIWTGSGPFRGFRLRQAFTVTFAEYHSADAILRRQKIPKGRGPRIVTVKIQRYEDKSAAPENIREIARRTLGEAGRWREVTTLAGKHFRDPGQRLKVGQRVKVPRQ